MVTSWRDALLAGLLCLCGLQCAAFAGLWVVLRATAWSRAPEVDAEPVGDGGRIVIVSRFDDGHKK